MIELGERRDPDIERMHRADRPLAKAIRMGRDEPDELIMDDEVAEVSLLRLSIRRGLEAETVMQSQHAHEEHAQAPAFGWCGQDIGRPYWPSTCEVSQAHTASIFQD